MAKAMLHDTVPAGLTLNPGGPPWGYEARIRLHGCRLDWLADPWRYGTRTAEGELGPDGFLGELVPAIGMNAYGGPWVKRFGQGPIEGITAFQPIETSSVICHADEKWLRWFGCVWSCKIFDPDIAVRLAARWFGGQAAEMNWVVWE